MAERRLYTLMIDDRKINNKGVILAIIEALKLKYQDCKSKFQYNDFVIGYEHIANVILLINNSINILYAYRRSEKLEDGHEPYDSLIDIMLKNNYTINEISNIFNSAIHELTLIWSMHVVEKENNERILASWAYLRERHDEKILCSWDNPYNI